MLVVGSAPCVHGVVWVKVRSTPLDVGDRVPMESDCRGEILTGKAAARVAVAGMAKIRVPVQMYEPKPAAPRYRQPDGDQDAAVSAEHQRGIADVEAVSDADREPVRISHNRFLVADAVGARPQIIAVPSRQHNARFPCAESEKAVVEARVAQGLGRLRCAGDGAGLGRAKPEVRRRADERDPRSRVACGRRGHRVFRASLGWHAAPRTARPPSRRAGKLLQAVSLPRPGRFEEMPSKRTPAPMVPDCHPDHAAPSRGRLVPSQSVALLLASVFHRRTKR